jgi:hypothetical protein
MGAASQTRPSIWALRINNVLPARAERPPEISIPTISTWDLEVAEMPDMGKTETFPPELRARVFFLKASRMRTSPEKVTRADWEVKARSTRPGMNPDSFPLTRAHKLELRRTLPMMVRITPIISNKTRGLVLFGDSVFEGTWPVSLPSWRLSIFISNSWRR